MQTNIPFLPISVIFFLLFSSCQQQPIRTSSATTVEERLPQEEAFAIPIPEAIYRKAPSYPWKRDSTLPFPKITKEHFRCRGNVLHPRKYDESSGNPVYLVDCDGVERHSLPIRDGKEFIYPVLLDLLNYFQEKTGKRVVITSGHCCPEHNRYLDPSPTAQLSKHQLGAAVTFYIDGMQHERAALLTLLHTYYRTHPLFQGKQAFTDFTRYEKGDTGVRTQPWYNKEVYVKWFDADEGRTVDNDHPFPYWQIQVRWDRDIKERVVYEWKAAHHSIHRW